MLLNKILDIVKESNVVRNFIYTSCKDTNGLRRNWMKCILCDWRNHLIFNLIILHSTEHIAPTGLYIRALCDGMDQALEPFREEIIELENTVLNDSYTPLALILCGIEKYTCLFSVLHSIIREVIIYISRVALRNITWTRVSFYSCYV